MSHHDPRERRGAHRMARDASAALLPSALAIIAVTALITALFVWRGQDPATDAVTDAGSSTSSSTSPTASASPKASRSATSSPKPSSSTAKSSPASSASTETTSEAVPNVAVVVLNQTTTKGLAAKVAKRLKNKGWTVAVVGNFSGAVPATTVYYPPGKQAAATTAAKDLPTPARVRPRFGNLSTSRLTIVVAANYPS